MERLEMLPRGRGWIGEPVMGKGICHQQVAKFVVDSGLGNTDGW